MRIGVNTLFLVPGDVGGTEVYLRSTLAAMAQGLADDTLVLFTNHENNALLRAELGAFPQVEFFPLPCRAAIRPVRILAEQTLLPLAARQARVDVLWSPGYTAPAFCHAPQAVTIHDLQYKTYPEDMGRIERIALDILVRTACRRSRAVIAISEFSRQEIIKYRFARPENIHVVLNGVSEEFACKEEEAEQTLRGIGVRRPFLLCVAHTYPHKHVDRLLEAFALLEGTIPHQLVIVGTARRGEAALRTSLLQIRRQERVLRLHSIERHALRVLYQEADVFILPSSYEGFGLPVLEALMAGTPVVTVRAASLPEVGGEAARYVAAPAPDLIAAKILETLGAAEEERGRRAAQGRAWAKGFTWERTAAQTLHVLRSLGR